MQTMTLELDVESFLFATDARNRSPRTLGQYRSELSRFCAWLAGQGIAETEQITRRHLDAYLVGLRDRGLAPNSVHAAFRAFRRFLRWYEATEHPAWRNPIIGYEGPSVPRKRLPAPSLDTIKAIIDTCASRTFVDDRDRALLLFFLDTGVRAKECAGVNVGDVDLRHGVVQINHAKGYESRATYPAVPVIRAIVRYLKHRGDVPDDAPLWVTAAGRRLTYWGLRQIVERRAQRAHVPMAPLHGFRRAFATAKNADGVGPVDLQHMLGHANLDTLWRYVDVDEVHLAKVQRATSPVARLLRSSK